MAKNHNVAISDFEASLIEAEENLVVDFQFALNWLMNDKKVSRTQLAELLGVSKARVTQLLDGSANPTLRTAARYFRALNEVCEISTPRLKELKRSGDWLTPSMCWSEIDEFFDETLISSSKGQSKSHEREHRQIVDILVRVNSISDNDNESGWNIEFVDESPESVFA